MAEEIKIRRAKIEDAKYFPKLALQMDYKITAKEADARLQTILHQEEDIILVAEYKKKIIGFLHGITIIEVLTPKTLRLGGLIVDPKYRRTGIATKMMQTLEDWAKVENYQIVLVPSNVKRKVAHKFYEKIGYEKIKSQFIYEKIF